MGTNTLNNRSAGEVILDTFFNDIHSALNVDLVGRNSGGVPTSGQNLGTTAIPWGTVRATGLVLNGASVDTSQLTSPSNRVISGKTRTTSDQPAFITPTSGSLSFSIQASTTSLIFDVNGTTVTANTNIAKTGLTAAPSTNNTALVNDTDAADQADTRLWGEVSHRKTITIDTVGSEISALIGKWAAFQMDNGSATEYFLAYVESATVLSRCMRGFFYDSALAPKNRIVFSNNDTITLLKLGWIFLEDDGLTCDVTYNNPTWSYASPSSPATGDYWYDLANNVWKRYDGASFQIIDRTLIGVFANTSAACVGARCIDFFGNYSSKSNMNLEVQSTEIVRSDSTNIAVNVMGVDIVSGFAGFFTWNITTDLATSADMYTATEQASTVYYLYLTNEGDTVISDITPYVRPDLSGWYHPHNPWRCVGAGYNNASSNITQAGAWENGRHENVTTNATGFGSTNTRILIYGTEILNKGIGLLRATSATDGDSYTCVIPGRYRMSASNRRAGGATTDLGLSLNSAQLTTNISSITNTDILDVEISAVSASQGGTIEAKTVRQFLIGDVIRPHTDATAADNNPYARITYTKIGEFVA